jgi:hypothetical protein
MTRVVFDGRLLEGERILWWGTPVQGFALTSRDGVLIPFSLIWAGIVTFYEVNALQKNNSLMADLWGIPLILIGIHLTIGRFFVDAWTRGRTTYALTDKRVLIHRRPPFGVFTALSLDKLSETKLVERSDGRGTILFGPDPRVVRTRAL